MRVCRVDKRRYVAAKAMLDSDHDMSEDDKASARELKITTLNNLATVCAKTGAANAADIPKHCDACLALDSKNVKALVNTSLLRLTSLCVTKTRTQTNLDISFCDTLEFTYFSIVRMNACIIIQ